MIIDIRLRIHRRNKEYRCKSANNEFKTSRGLIDGTKTDKEESRRVEGEEMV